MHCNVGVWQTPASSPTITLEKSVLLTFYIGWCTTSLQQRNTKVLRNFYDFVVQYKNLEFLHIEAHTNKQDEHSIGNHYADLLATNSLKDYHK